MMDDQWRADWTSDSITIRRAYNTPPEGSIEETPLHERSDSDTRMLSCEACVFRNLGILRIDTSVQMDALRKVVTRDGKSFRDPGVLVDRLTMWRIFGDVAKLGKTWVDLRAGGRLPPITYVHEPRTRRNGPYPPRSVTLTLLRFKTFAAAPDAHRHDIKMLEAMGIPVDPMEDLARARLWFPDLIPPADPETQAAVLFLLRRTLDSIERGDPDARSVERLLREVGREIAIMRTTQ
jgi:hypothetical protein